MRPDPRRVLAGLELSHYGLDGLMRREPVTLYHGITAMFRRFDMAKVRKVLVDDFYGEGMFFSPTKSVAWKYARANRNIGFPETIVDDMRSKNPVAGEYLGMLVDMGRDAWDAFCVKHRLVGPDESPDYGAIRDMVGVDPNILADIAQYVIGTKYDRLADNDPASSLFGESTGMPSYMYENAADVGLDPKDYCPKVYTVVVTAENPLVTKNLSQAARARAKGFDCVVYWGKHAVSNVPEVAVFDPGQIKIVKIEFDDD